MTGARLRMTAGVAAMAMAGLISVGAAKAQTYGYGNPEYVTTTEGVTVYAPRHYYGRSSSTGAPIEAVRESRVVYARDLDLSTYWGARTLRHRIESAARDACDDLDARYPITEDAPRACFDGAVHGA